MLFWHFFTHLIFSRRAGALIRRIAILSSVAIFVSVTAFLLIMFVMSGMNESIEKRILALEPHLSLTVSGENAQRPELNPIVQKILQDPEVKSSVFETQDVILRTMDGQFHGAIMRGLDEKGLKLFLRELENLQHATRSGLSFSNEGSVAAADLPGEGELLLGIDLARSLGVFEGDSLLVLSPESLLLPPGEVPRTERLRIRKIIATNLADIDSQFAFYRRGAAMASLKGSGARRSGVDLWLADGSRADRFKASLPERSDLVVETWTERNSALFFALRMEKTMIGSFLGLAGLIATSSILTVMALLLSQKRRDLALLRVVGLSGRDSIRLFTQIGLCLAAVGALGGLLVGTGLGLWIEKYPLNILPDIYYDSQIPSRVDGFYVILVFGVVTCLSFLGAWIPARAASRIEAAEALRSKN